MTLGTTILTLRKNPKYEFDNKNTHHTFICTFTLMSANFLITYQFKNISTTCNLYTNDIYILIQ